MKTKIKIPIKNKVGTPIIPAQLTGSINIPVSIKTTPKLIHTTENRGVVFLLTKDLKDINETSNPININDALIVDTTINFVPYYILCLVLYHTDT